MLSILLGLSSHLVSIRVPLPVVAVSVPAPTATAGAVSPLQIRITLPLRLSMRLGVILRRLIHIDISAIVDKLLVLILVSVLLRLGLMIIAQRIVFEGLGVSVWIMVVNVVSACSGSGHTRSDTCTGSEIVFGDTVDIS